MLKILNFFRGSVRVRLTSEYPERFINVCAQNRIALWDIERRGPDGLSASMLPGGYKRILPFAARGVGRIDITGRMGLPYFLLRFRRRYALLAGMALMSAALGALSLFIWEIDVSGNETVPREMILQKLGELGVGIGTYRGHIDSKEIQNLMILAIPELEWLAVNVSGSRADVGVREREPAPEIIPRDLPCNIVSRKDGLIISINTLEGAPAVTAGQAVEKGQLLVSGLINSNIVGLRRVHAMAEVTARTWYEYASVIPASAVGKRYTGREKNRYAVIIAGRRFSLYREGREPALGTEKTVERKTLRLGGSFTLPFTWVTETLTEYEPTEFTVSPASAAAFMEYALNRRLLYDSDGGEILSVSFKTAERNGVYLCEMSAECLESVAVTAPMP